MRTSILALLSLLPLLLTGCMGDGSGAKVAAVNLEYDGAESGEHEEKLQCDNDGQVTGSGRVEDGNLVVTVSDGDGKAIFERTYDNEFSFDSESISGKNGGWTLRAERNGDDVLGDEFKGEYSFNLTC